MKVTDALLQDWAEAAGADGPNTIIALYQSQALSRGPDGALRACWADG